MIILKFVAELIIIICAFLMTYVGYDAIKYKEEPLPYYIGGCICYSAGIIMVLCFIRDVIAIGGQ